MINDPSTVAVGLLSVVLPFLISLLVDPKAAPRFKALLTFMLCLIVTIFATIVVGQFKPGTEVNGMGELLQLYLQNLAVCFITSVSVYNGIVRPTGAASNLEHQGGKLGQP